MERYDHASGYSVVLDRIPPMLLKTKAKIAVACAAYRMIRFARQLAGLSDITRVRRHNLDWKLDLAEGIDLSIYLLGGFEPRTLKFYERAVKPGHTVVDIGANIGSHTLPLAQLVGSDGRVIAFEPTKFAFEKLKANISLNQQLALRITAVQAMLTDKPDAVVPPLLYSSWPLKDREGLHENHEGKLKGTEGAYAGTLDNILNELDIKKVDLMKLDVDGNELAVLKGAAGTLARHKPVIVMELSPCVHSGKENDAFEELIKHIADSGYCFKDLYSGKPLASDPAALERMIPYGAGINVLVVPE